MTLTLWFYHHLRVKWVCIHTENSSRQLDKLIHDSGNVYGCLTLNKMRIELASLITSLTNCNLTNTSSTPPPKVKKIIIYSKLDSFVYIKRNFHLFKISG